MTYHVPAAVIDVGSRNNLGWAIDDGGRTLTGADLGPLIDELAAILQRSPLALGFEAPMFVPIRSRSERLTAGRSGEADRAFSTAAGSCALVTGLVTVTCILSELRGRCPNAIPTFDWTKTLGAGDLLLFEAFVTHQIAASGENGHIRDAKDALKRFREGFSAPTFLSAVNEPNCLNLLGAMLLRTGWTDDFRFLREQCLVVRHKGKRRLTAKG